MKLLFIETGTRYKVDENGKKYTDGNLNRKIWERYIKYCDALTIMGRKENHIYQSSYSAEKFNEVINNVEVVLLEDLYKPKKNFLSIKKRTAIKKQLEQEIKKHDAIIIRSVTNFYTITAAKICKKLNKRYMIEITGSAFETLWHHDVFLGKILAPIAEYKKIKIVKKAPYVLYVTQSILQEQYPTNGIECGCSDVEIELATNKQIDKRKEYIKNKDLKKKIIIGTIGNIDTRLKGQKDVIKVISKLIKDKNMEFEYELVGRGKQEYLKNIAEKEGIIDKVKFIGELPHENIVEWLDHIDIYIHPSYTEGLCRSIIEAMGRGCPIIASDAGGNKELIDKRAQFRKGNKKELKKIFENLNNELLYEECIKNYQRAIELYSKEKLDKKRDDFYRIFVSK